jgi:hypothetical protein
MLMLSLQVVSTRILSLLQVMVMARPQTSLPPASVCLLVRQVVLASSALAVILLVQTEHAYKIAFALLEDLFKMENAS